MRCPVLAAGGIADAQGVRAAMALGASGIQVGTSYMLCNEAFTSAPHRAALRSETQSGASGSAVTTLFTGRPARGIVNRVMREMGVLNPHVPHFPMATAAMAPLRTMAEALGLGDFCPLWARQNTHGCREIGAAELTIELVRGFA